MSLQKAFGVWATIFETPQGRVVANRGQVNGSFGERQQYVLSHDEKRAAAAL